jgi:hypothetical protein
MGRRAICQPIVRLLSSTAASVRPSFAKKLGVQEVVLTRAYTSWVGRSASTGRRMPPTTSMRATSGKIADRELAYDFEQLRLEFLGRRMSIRPPSTNGWSSRDRASSSSARWSKRGRRGRDRAHARPDCNPGASAAGKIIPSPACGEGGGVSAARAVAFSLALPTPSRVAPLCPSGGWAREPHPAAGGGPSRTATP